MTMGSAVPYLVLCVSAVAFGCWLARRAAETTRALLEEQIKLGNARLDETEAEARRLGSHAEALGREASELRAEAAALRVSAERAIKLDAVVADVRACLLTAQERLAGAEA